MLNSRPNNPTKYHQGLYVPKNKNKVIKLNAHGGLWYRSSLEQKMMIYLDNNPSIIRWSSEPFDIKYKLREKNRDGIYEMVEHRYYADFYYEQLLSDGRTNKVIAEVKPTKDVNQPIMPKKTTPKALKNYEYDIKMYEKNLSKWRYMIEHCKNKGIEFVIITDQTLNKYVKI